MTGSASRGPARLEVGRIGRPHGLRGEVRVSLTTNRQERAEPGAVLFAGDRRLEVESSRPDGRQWVVRFAGVDDRDAATALAGTPLEADPLGPLAGGELWLHELVGAAVTDVAGRALGEVVAIEANPAHDLLVLDAGGLIPLVFVTEVRDGRVVVDVPEGLLEATTARRPAGTDG